MKEYIICETDFFIESPNEEVGRIISLIYMDIFSTFEESKKHIQQFESHGLKVVDYEVKFRPLKSHTDSDHTKFTKH